jgi:hypothetical protein
MIVFSIIYGAPEEIRTPDPQIRSLVLNTRKITSRGGQSMSRGCRIAARANGWVVGDDELTGADWTAMAAVATGPLYQSPVDPLFGSLELP